MGMIETRGVGEEGNEWQVGSGIENREVPDPAHHAPTFLKIVSTD